MIDLDARTFDPAAQNVQCLACVFYRGPWEDVEDAVVGVQERLESPPPVWTRLDLEAAPQVAAAFGLSGGEPHLLLMRERIVLHLAPLAIHGARETAALIDRAMAVDMQAARRRMTEERLAQSHLFARRICPTAHRRKR